MQADPVQQAVYGTNPRRELLGLLPGGVGSALDVGCGRGGLARTLREVYGPSCTVVGIEPVAEQAAAAREEDFAEVLNGYFPDALAGRSDRFDLITFNDVLEHMVDPWTVLEQTREHLTPTGRVLATIPNIQYAPVVAGLIRGDWTYTETGVLDVTHLRFFTRRTMLDLFDRAGFDVESCTGVSLVWGHEWRNDAPGGVRRQVGRIRSLGRHLALKRCPDAAYMQFVIVATPRPHLEEARR